jgi:hypothetical protein
MRRSAAAFAAIVLTSGCQDHHQPMGPALLWNVGAVQETSGNPHVWILGRSFTLSDGTVCTHIQQDDAEGSAFGVECDGAFHDWSGVEFNTELYPVVEICRLDTTAGACAAGAANRAVFVRGPGEIGLQNTKYRLTMREQAWWDRQDEGVYRVIVGITFTGLTDPAGGNYTPVPGWDTQSDKVLGYYDLVREGSNSNHVVQFRIRRGALCEGGPEAGACVETSFDPQTQSTLVFDDEYNLTTGTGIVGLKFPPNMGVVVQQKINIIIEKVSLQTGERCISSDRFVGGGPVPGRELAPCYNIRTEPFIDLATLPEITDPIRFAMCLDDPAAESNVNLLQMLKWSAVKNRIDDLRITFEDSFFGCDDGLSGSVGSADATGWSRFAAFRTIRSPANGSLMDFSRIVVQADDHYEAAYLSPVGSADPLSEDNLGQVAATVSVTACLLAGDECASPTASPSNNWQGTATWNEGGYYQVNWNTPRNQAPGTYRITLTVRDYVVVASDEINITFGTASYTHNAGRTLPVKFYLKRS